MDLLLKSCGEIEFRSELVTPGAKEGHTLLRVLACAVCRTDAKMWRQGHRDLKLPRVLGHEIAGVDETTGTLYTVWPGQACGHCIYCLGGRENLCEEMKIIGFHDDGGFATHVLVPDESLVPVDEKIDPLCLTFSEPVACVINAMSFLQPLEKIRAVIYGGGVLGVLAALLFREKGWQVTVIEQSQEKIARLTEVCSQNNIVICKDTVDADFDLAINCCDSHIAFSLCVTKLRKGGQLLFFSGLAKNEEIDTNLLNLIHYKELEIYGSYGPRREHMVAGAAFCLRQQRNISLLIESVIEPRQIESILPAVLSGKCLKYIVDFRDGASQKEYKKAEKEVQHSDVTNDTELSSTLLTVVNKISYLSEEVKNKAQKKVDLKTKPLGALGRLEELAVQMSCIQNSLNPQTNCKRMFVFAGDHGVVEEGVSAFPAKVTVQMVENFLDGGAAINTFCNQYDIELGVVDMGVNGEFLDHPLLEKRKVAPGTENFAIKEAMTVQQSIQAIEEGAAVFLAKNRIESCDVVGVGEMGIGNTSSATAIICAATGLSPEQVAGRGTGVDDRGLDRKIEVIQKALDLHNPDGSDGLELLRTVGGYELGGICGTVLAAASEGCCVVLDGIISTAAGLLAYLICPAVKQYLVAGHKSVEVGQKAALAIMGLDPVLDLDFRLGEGTGAAITMNLVELSCKMMRDMASFEEAGVDSGSL